jgi:hypothetical protein
VRCITRVLAARDSLPTIAFPSIEPSTSYGTKAMIGIPFVTRLEWIIAAYIRACRYGSDRTLPLTSIQTGKTEKKPLGILVRYISPGSSKVRDDVEIVGAFLGPASSCLSNP